MPAVSANDPRPPYVQIADDLRRAIQAGELAAGQRLESGRRLAQEYGVAPMTVQSALAVLRDEGLVVSWQGRGVFVTDKPSDGMPTGAPTRITSRLDDVAAEVAELRDRVVALEKRRPK